MQPLRAAGLNERRCIARDTLSLYGTIVTVGTYTQEASRSGHVLTREDVYRVLKDVVARQPVLSTVVQDAETEAPRLARIPLLDLSRHVRFLEARESGGDEGAFLREFLEGTHAEPLSEYEERPQWRVYVVPELAAGENLKRRIRVAFASSHAICDGAAGLIFHRAFLDALRGLDSLPFSSDAVCETLREPKLLPPLEEIADFTISWSFLLGPLLNEYLPTWITSLLGSGSEVKDSRGVDRAWTGAASRPTRPPPMKLPPTDVECVDVSPETLDIVLATCRRHGARLTGLLNYLVARSLARALLAQGESYGKFVVETAIDLRRCLLQAQGQMGNFVSVSIETTHFDPQQLKQDEKLTEEHWSAIGRATQRLSKASQTLADQPIALLKYLSKFRDWTLKKADAPANGAFGMSNIGVFVPGRDVDSSWSMEAMTFSQSADCTNAPFNLNVASCQDGKLWLVLSWWSGMLGVRDERKLMRDICDDILAQLKAIAS